MPNAIILIDGKSYLSCISSIYTIYFRQIFLYWQLSPSPPGMTLYTCSPSTQEHEGGHHKFEDSLAYVVSSRPKWDTQWNLTSTSFHQKWDKEIWLGFIISSISLWIKMSLPTQSFPHTKSLPARSLTPSWPNLWMLTQTSFIIFAQMIIDKLLLFFLPRR